MRHEGRRVQGQPAVLRLDGKEKSATRYGILADRNVAACRVPELSGQL